MVEVRRLAPDETAPFAAFTFPLLRPLLDDATRPVRAIAWGAYDGGDPVGLAFGMAAPDRQFELLSLYVAPLWVGQSIGSRLLQALEEHYRGEGCELGVHFFTIRENEHDFARFLMYRGWSKPTIRQVICQTTPKLILASPLKACAHLPRSAIRDGYRIIGWAEVTPEQRATIHERSRREPGWYPDQLNPFRHEQDCLLDTSIALMHDDDVVGWLFSHVLDERTLRMTCSFVAKELEPRGRVLHLWWAAAARQDSRTPLTRSIWTVPISYSAHVQFVIKRVKPWMESFSYACTSIKRYDTAEFPAASDRSS